MVFLLEGPYFIIIYSLYVIGSKKKKKDASEYYYFRY